MREDPACLRGWSIVWRTLTDLQSVCLLPFKWCVLGQPLGILSLYFQVLSTETTMQVSG